MKALWALAGALILVSCAHREPEPPGYSDDFAQFMESFRKLPSCGQTGSDDGGPDAVEGHLQLLGASCDEGGEICRAACMGNWAIVLPAQSNTALVLAPDGGGRPLEWIAGRCSVERLKREVQGLRMRARGRIVDPDGHSMAGRHRFLRYAALCRA